MRRLFAFAFLPLALAASGASATPPSPSQVSASQPAALSTLVSQVDIPYQTFTLDNGLRVIVHEDHKAPVVAVSVWYSIGSKDEPTGKTGFAHLFEHLMFNGSENAPGEYFEPMEQIGATDLNGTTWFDRTNYFETVPRAAIETALFMESDRMGHLLGAVTQDVLDNQRSVVQNEKRQGDNQPYGLVEYHQLAALFPDGHPYHHSTIGSMADLDAASLDTVKGWFKDHYGPNNAVLVLAGDIDVGTAKNLVERYFGDIPRGPQNHPAEAPVPTLPKTVSETMHDQVATTRIYRDWVVPGLLDPDAVPLDVAAGVLGGLASSRLDNTLVRQEQTAVRVSAEMQTFHRISMFEVQVDVKPGVDADVVARRLDQLIADYIKNGPSADEVQRFATSSVASRIRGLEQVGGFDGKAVALAEGALYADDPGFYKKQLEQLAAVTPADVKAVMQKWLTRPSYDLLVAPGEREDTYEESSGGKAAMTAGTSMPQYYRAPRADEHPLAPNPAALAAQSDTAFQGPLAPSDSLATGSTRQPATAVDRSHLPTVGQIDDLDFPDVEHSKLSNGIPVTFAHREAVPVVYVSIDFDAGTAADRPEKAGLQSLMAALLDEGTTSLDSIAIAETRERLGATLGASAGLDRTTVTLGALKSNLAPSLDLMADVVKNPAFAPSEIERLRAQRLATIASELTQPSGIALRTLPPLLYGTAYPYSKPLTGSGTPEAVKSLTRADIVGAHDAWMRPDKAEIFVVGDTTLAEILPQLEARFGDWRAPAAAAGTKAFDAAITPPKPRIILVDRPQSPQSMILAGEVTAVNGTDDLVPLLQANTVLGGSFLSRLNYELRENKGWAYGAQGIVYRVEHRVPYIVYAPVQANRTGDSIKAIQDQLTSFLGTNGVTSAELERTINGAIRELPGTFETSSAVLSALSDNALYDRPDDYYETITSRLRGLHAADLDTAVRAVLDPSKLVWVVVGDAAQVRPQLDALGIPVEMGTAQ